MFRVKICGVATPDDGLLAVDAGADAIGLNFFPGSPRFIARDRAIEIVAAVGNRAQKVGVFVNASTKQVIEHYETLGLDLVQLHGDEPPAFLQALGDLPVIRAFRCGLQGLGPIAADLEACRILGSAPRMVLVDAYDRKQYGGSGRTAPWGVVARFRELRFPYPLILSGGLTPENVAEGISRVRPTAVDVASGVELSPGKKDPQRVRAFVERALATYSNPLPQSTP